MDHTQMRTWAEVNLDNIEHNYKAMRARLSGSTRFLGVVKANAYGHGAVRVSGLLQELGCDYLAVACIDEAIDLRRNGITLPILIMGYTPPEFTPELIANNITQTVTELDMAEACSRIAVSEGKKLKVHIKVDTGMGRLGFTYYREGGREEDMLAVMALQGLDIEGIFTHFAVSDVVGDTYTERQFQAFTDIAGRLERDSGKKFMIKHCSSSGAMINCEKAYLDMVRPGILLYGCYPAAETGGLGLRPAMELKTRIVQIRDLQAGDTVSYGRIYKAPSPKKIAAIAIGYADGLPRLLSGKIDVLVRGRRARQVGRICMDICMIDVTGIPDAAVGDVVTVFGCDGNETIAIEEQAATAGTISYEMLCGVSPRVPRVYLRHGDIL